MLIELQLGKLNERKHWVDLSVDGKIIIDYYECKRNMKM
jgi:hypothetical protein